MILFVQKISSGFGGETDNLALTSQWNTFDFVLINAFGTIE
jgi:hypothetical protein